MKKLDLYIAQTIALTMVLASFGLIAIFVIFTFLEQMDDIKNDYTIWMVVKFLALSIPRMFYETVPYASLIGCMSGLGVLAGNSELIVMRSAGISTWQIAWAATKPVLLLVVLGIIVGELILPDFERSARLMREEAMESDISPKEGFWYRERGAFMHFRTVVSPGELEDVNQYYTAKNATGTTELIKTVWAENAVYESTGVSGQWILSNVIMTELSGGKKVKKQFDELVWKTDLTPTVLSSEILVHPDKMSILELRGKIIHMEQAGLNTGKFELGFWSKIFQPIASLSLVFIAISFVFGPLRETTMGVRVVSGLIIGIVFKFFQDLLSPASLVFGFPLSWRP